MRFEFFYKFSHRCNSLSMPCSRRKFLLPRSYKTSSVCSFVAIGISELKEHLDTCWHSLPGTSLCYSILSIIEISCFRTVWCFWRFLKHRNSRKKWKYFFNVILLCDKLLLPNPTPRDFLLKPRILVPRASCTQGLFATSVGCVVVSGDITLGTRVTQQAKFYYWLVFFKEHIARCPFEILNCINVGCDMQVIRQELEVHRRQCAYRKVACHYCNSELVSKDTSVSASDYCVVVKVSNVLKRALISECML